MLCLLMLRRFIVCVPAAGDWPNGYDHVAGAEEDKAQWRIQRGFRGAPPFARMLVIILVFWLFICVAG